MNGHATKTPTKLKAFGLLCLAGVLLVTPNIVRASIRLAEAFGDHALSDVTNITRALLIVLVSLIGLTAAVLAVMGVRLLLNRRRGARLAAELTVILLVLDLLCAMMLFGIHWRDLYFVAAIVLLVVLLTAMDPTLSEERQLQHRLRRLETEQAVEDGTLGRDTTGKGYIQLDFFNLFWIFVVACVVGDVLETVWHVIVVDPGHFQQRAGMLWGPFSPIYGFGAVLMTLALNRFHKANVLVVFLVSALIGGAFEYFVSWFLQFAFGVTAWDYSGTFLNIGGRTDFFFMCMWGALGVVWIRLCLPGLLKLVNLIPWKLRYVITAVCAALMLVNGAMTLMALDCWYLRLSGDSPDSAVEVFFAEHFDNQWMADRFQSMSIDPESTARA